MRHNLFTPNAVTDAEGRPIRFLIPEGQVSDPMGAEALLDGLPKADWLLVDHGYDTHGFRDCLKNKWIMLYAPERTSRGKTAKQVRRRYSRRNRIEIIFGRLKD